ncbi:hypothetical protein CSKR_106497 [Clonorchis sinensis]|uniref:Uncharacterized protein n=1 Tax=Clonorchis sinensis TaxID=79923 RepID=A0A3R7D746_CLOSI|nr:hypothetical protein CSKR_106497 [Clonorchis sinensis]
MSGMTVNVTPTEEPQEGQTLLSYLRGVELVTHLSHSTSQPCTEDVTLTGDETWLLICSPSLAIDLQTFRHHSRRHLQCAVGSYKFISSSRMLFLYLLSITVLWKRSEKLKGLVSPEFTE